MEVFSTDAVSFIIAACSHKKSYSLLNQKNDFEAVISFIFSPESISPDTSIIILEQSALNQYSLLSWKKSCFTAIFIIEHPVDDDECILVLTGIPDVFLKSALIKALSHLNIKQQLELSHKNLQHNHEKFLAY